MRVDYELAGRLHRIIANILDSVLMSILSWLIWLFLIIPFLILPTQWLTIAFIQTLANALINIYFWSRGTSLGKAIFGMKVVDKNTGETLGLLRMAFREIVGKWVSGLIFSLGFIWILFDRDKQGWHDKMVNSVVIR